MGTCICVPNMPGVRCGELLRHGIENQLIRQLGFSVRRAVVPQWGTQSALEEGSMLVSQSRHIGSLESQISLDAAVLRRASALSTYSFHRSQSSHTFGTKIAERVVWGYSKGLTNRFISGLGSASRASLSPRVAPELPETGQSWIESQRLCPGCGIEMQEENPKAPGFFQRPVPVERARGEEVHALTDAELLSLIDGGELEGEEKDVLERVAVSSASEMDLEDDMDLGESRRGRRKKEKRARKDLGLAEAKQSSEGEKPTVCVRCFALRNYGKVKDESVENLLPDFDFEHVVGGRLRKSVGRRALVLMVIDSVDFDGSFPRIAATLLADAVGQLATSWQEGKAANVPRLLIVLNKVDLLPGGLSPVRLEQWARRRSRAGGVTEIGGVHIVSAAKGWGVDKLFKQVIEMAGPRGDVWVIGAQNVGKSSLINALGKLTAEGAEGKKNNTFLTEAALPGTTVGVLKLEGILPHKARILDTPGLLHPHQITTRLTREEQKMVQIRKVLKPRTFRVKVGHAVSVGGLMRLTVQSAPGESIYATVWASPFIPCHMGKAESSQELFDKHVGEKLQPPLSKERVEELGRWVARIVEVSGDKWDKSSVDVAVAGVGWIGLAFSGFATLQIWTYEGVAVTVRDAMLYDLAKVMERPGFAAIKTSGKGKIDPWNQEEK